MAPSAKRSRRAAMRVAFLVRESLSIEASGVKLTLSFVISPPREKTLEFECPIRFRHGDRAFAFGFQLGHELGKSGDRFAAARTGRGGGHIGGGRVPFGRLFAPAAISASRLANVELFVGAAVIGFPLDRSQRRAVARRARARARAGAGRCGFPARRRRTKRDVLPDRVSDRVDAVRACVRPRVGVHSDPAES